VVAALATVGIAWRGWDGWAIVFLALVLPVLGGMSDGHRTDKDYPSGPHEREM
jgi:hypothetical protein